MRQVYLDYAATSPVDKNVVKAIQPYFSSKFGNPSSLHSWGQQAKKSLEASRKTAADFLNASMDEIVFTSSATEANNLVLKGAVSFWQKQNRNKTPHLIVSSAEHHCVLNTARVLEKQGAEVAWLKADKYGLVDIRQILDTVKANTVLVSVIYGNNEVGTINPINKIGQEIKKIRQETESSYPYLHTDAVQAVQYLNMDVKTLGADLLSASAHKFSGPKGTGFLYVKKGTGLIRQQDGGGQEFGLRSGTENIPGIVGLAKALEIVKQKKEKEVKRLVKLRNGFIKRVLKEVPKAQLTGHPSKRLPHIASFVFPGAEGEAILLYLNDKGIAASSGSACTSGTLEPSHVLLSMGIKPEVAHSSIRFSLGADTSKKDLDYVVSALPGIINKLRKMAPKL
jgi:cysteine desulfurase